MLLFLAIGKARGGAEDRPARDADCLLQLACVTRMCVGVCWCVSLDRDWVWLLWSLVSEGRQQRILRPFFAPPPSSKSAVDRAELQKGNGPNKRNMHNATFSLLSVYGFFSSFVLSFIGFCCSWVACREEAPARIISPFLHTQHPYCTLY